MTDSKTFDLFDGLPLDYNFLEGGRDSSSGVSLNAEGSNSSFNEASSTSTAYVMLDDQMLLDSDVPSSSPTNMMAPKSEGEDLLTPLNFSFNPNVSTAMGTNYRVAPQHKHKRVRSNPDILQGLGIATMAPSVITQPALPPHRLEFTQQHNVMSLGLDQIEPLTDPVQLVGIASSHGESFQEMDEFLKDLSWTELNNEHKRTPSQLVTVNGNGYPSTGALPVDYRTQRIQEGVNELKMKRKRPVNHHIRHHSNPVNLLYNLDQFRVLAQQNKEQRLVPLQVHQQAQQNINPNQGYSIPIANYLDSTSFLALPQINVQQVQFQVPPEIASGATISLHGRRSSLGSNLPPRAAARSRTHRSSGLSMDMSQMNLDFLSVLEEPNMTGLASQRSPERNSSSPSASSSGSKKISLDDINKKMYKCGRCGQPKVGHICTMPDQRNNWTQADLEVTKGLKVTRVNCHILPVKTRWVMMCEDHEPMQLLAKGSAESEG